MGSLDANLSTARRLTGSSTDAPGSRECMRVPRHLLAPPVIGLVWPVAADPDGESGPTRGRARGAGWRCTSRGWFVPATVTQDTVEQRILEAYVAAGPGAVVTGWAALRLLGGGYFDGSAQDGRTRLPVPIAANGGRVRSRPGVVVSRFIVPPDEVTMIHGMRCASPERALFDELRRLTGVRQRTVAIDMACAAQLTSILRMRRYLKVRRWYRDVRTVVPSLDLADERSWSGPETKFRMVWEVDAGWGHPLCNREIFHVDGHLVGVPDLIDPRRAVVGEYAGEHHREIDQHTKDLGRGADFRGVGLEVVEVNGPILRDRRLVVERLHDAESRAGLLPQLWRLGPEPKTLDQILDERDAAEGIE